MKFIVSGTIAISRSGEKDPEYTPTSLVVEADTRWKAEGAFWDHCDRLAFDALVYGVNNVTVQEVRSGE